MEFLLQGVAWLLANEELTVALLSHSSVLMLRGQVTRNVALLRDSGRNILVKILRHILLVKRMP